MNDPRPQIMAELEQARAEILVLLDTVDKNRKIYPLWTIREILAHIAGWDDAIIASLKAHIEDREPGTPAARGINAYNAETVSTREGLDYDHIYREYIHTRDILVALIKDMPLEKTIQPFIQPWGGENDLVGLLKIFIEHEIEHAGDIREIISRADTA